MFQYLTENGQRNIKFISRLELEPHTVIGEHLHDSDEEFYLVLEGDGKGVLDGESFDLEAGDAFVCKTGHTHGITAGKKGLTFLAVLS
ncbi:MAG TPA: cupin domain-containing protein [Acidobacteriota bacterium]|jgi:quercetin dioxygenase-like cupin family protein|nr:cupin domain-containing protein [Acidobacteriota bacterium]HNT16635.1 cupin domain-containing protein [Acidobacteriota bacterium]